MPTVIDAIRLPQDDPRLLTLAIVIAAITAFAVVSLLARVRMIGRDTLVVWYGAAVVFGCGLWALQFAVLLSLAAPVEVGYDLTLTLIALFVSVVGALGAFAAFLAGRDDWRGPPLAGLMLGVSLVGAHLVGIAAIRPATGSVADDAPLLVPAVMAVGFSMLMFARAEGARPVLRRLEVSLYLLAALAGLCLIGTAGLLILPGPAGIPDGARLGSDALPIALGAAGFVVLALSLASDVLERQALHQSQLESGRLLQLVGAAFEGIVIHREGRIIEANEAFCRLGGWTAEALQAGRLIDLVAGEDPEKLAFLLTGPDDTAEPLTFDLVAADGRRIPVEIVSRTIEHDGKRASVSGFRDLSARLRAEERIRHLAHHDALTGLPNRFLLVDRLTQALSLARRNNTTVAVFHLDLGRFKAVNDLLGHEAGDQLLIEVGQRLLETLRASDTLARLSGDEFVIIQPLVQQVREAAALARRVVEALSTPFDIFGHPAEISVSIGIAVFPQDGASPTELMHNADTAMYRAKQDGHGTYLFFEPAMDRQIQERRQLEQDLRRAITRGEFVVHYQPLFECEAQTVSGFEALLRWQHPTRGMISPSEFIPLAEECGLIHTLGRWVLETACREAVGWAVPHRIAVNLSPVQFRQPDLPQLIAETLARTGLPPERLELEITEGVLIDNPDRAIAVLTALKALGTNISLDDFGTGYSSLSYLRRFPFDKIKIDQSFVKGLGEDDEARAIVQAIVALGRSLRLSVTAEGVETEGQLAQLRLLRCNQVQGFLLGRPMEQHHLPALFRNG